MSSASATGLIALAGAGAARWSSGPLQPVPGPPRAERFFGKPELSAARILVERPGQPDPEVMGFLAVVPAAGRLSGMDVNATQVPVTFTWLRLGGSVG